jgi:hypothetical protein
VLGHPAGEADALMRAERLLSELRAALSADQLEAAMARGMALDLDVVVQQILE